MVIEGFEDSKLPCFLWKNRKEYPVKRERPQRRQLDGVMLSRSSYCGLRVLGRVGRTGFV
eukprot:scaffold4472_cov180-Amphora_coffeaeformis.AAC.6